MIRFSLFGFPVNIHWMFWVVSAVLGGALDSSSNVKNVLVWIGVVFVSILWHELGHAFAFRKYGGRPSITLYGMGGVAQSSGRLTRQQDIIISLAGPFFGFALGLAVWLISKAVPLSAFQNQQLAYLFGAMLFVNIIWSAVNLLPVLPLDGGRVCSAVLSGKNPTLAPKIGMVTAVVMVVVAIKYGQIYVAVLFGFFAYQNWQMLQGMMGRPTGGNPFQGFGGGGGRR
jgi:stage IV sporulation protein FB